MLLRGFSAVSQRELVLPAAAGECLGHEAGLGGTLSIHCGKGPARTGCPAMTCFGAEPRPWTPGGHHRILCQPSLVGRACLSLAGVKNAGHGETVLSG